MLKLKKLFSGRTAAFAAAGALSVMALVAPDAAMAAPSDVAGLAGAVEGNIQAVKQLAVSVAFMIGIILFIAGLYLVYKDSKQPGQDHAKKGFISLIVGTALLLLPVMVEVAGGTLGGDADAAKNNAKSAKGF